MKHRKIGNIEVGGLDMADYPDFSDAYITYAEWGDTGLPLNGEELDQLNDSDYRGELINDYTL